MKGYEVEQEPKFEATHHESHSLSMWLTHFLMFMQAVFRLSDTVIPYFIRFLRVFFSVLGRSCKIAAEIAEYLPSSLYKAVIYENRLIFRKYVICKRCHRIYYFSDCVKFPCHPQQRMRVPCGSLLQKSVELANGAVYLYPQLTYCYLSLEVSLQSFLLWPDFFSSCELWRSREVNEGILKDIYDGKIWNEFQDFHGQPFLSEPGNFVLMLNMDFFQPYKQVQYSLGAIYLTILNLPRDIRNRPENTILVGLILGPHEPHHDINSFLEPLVTELQQLWTGTDLNVHSQCAKKKIHCALVCVACDLPVGRKVRGFLSHNARLGCSRCWTQFSGTVGSMDFSGFDREQWRLRSGSEHKQLASCLRSKRTESEIRRVEAKYGCRYSVLLELPYFDAPRMLIVDPMHNLFLGSAKHFLKSVFIGKGIITESQFDTIQKRVFETYNMQLVLLILDVFHTRYIVDSLHSQLTNGRIGLCISHYYHYMIF